MRIVIFGTDHFATQTLKFLLESKYDVVGVVTREDKPVGRKQILTAPPVKQYCIDNKLNIPLMQPKKASTDAFISEVKALKPDIFVVISYGEIMKQALLDVPSKICINIHPSLLPKHRGPSPMQSSIIAGDSETGVSIMEMALKMDAGPVLAVEKMGIPRDMTSGELEERLIALSRKPLKQVLDTIISGKDVQKHPQDESKATYTEKISTKNSFIPWVKGREAVQSFVLGYNPRPGARTNAIIDGKEQAIKIFRCHSVEGEASEEVKVVGYHKGDKLILSLPGGCLSIDELQPENKKKMSAKDFMNGFSEPEILTK